MQMKDVTNYKLFSSQTKLFTLRSCPQSELLDLPHNDVIPNKDVIKQY